MNDQTRPLVFVLMPFSTEYDDLFENGIKPAAELAGASAQRVDEQKFLNDDILDRINNQIDEAAAIVAVASGGRPNVFYEIGLAHAVRKHVVLLVDDPANIPFDVNHFRALSYKTVDVEFVRQLSDELTWRLSTPLPGDSYFQEFKNAFREVESLGKDLTRSFTPIAKRFFYEWTEYIRSVVAEGIDMRGPERLAITRLLTAETHEYSLIERITGNPNELHSKDWIAYYDQIGGQENIKKSWMLCVEAEEVRTRHGRVEAGWRFFRDRNFATHYCSPTDFELSAGERLPAYQVIENFGKYVKLLKLPGAAYTSGEKANMLNTTIRVCNRRDQAMLQSLAACAQTIDERWIERFSQSIPGPG